MKRHTLVSEVVNPFIVLADVVLMTTLILFLYLITQSLQLNREAFALRMVQKQKDATVEGLKKEYRSRWGANKQVYAYSELGIQHIYFSDNILFDSGKFDLNKNGRQALHHFYVVMRRRMSENKEITLTIEGHTDAVPYPAQGGPRRDYDNWNLSADRALSVVRYLQGKDCGLPPERMAASGRGQFDPAPGEHNPRDPKTGEPLPDAKNRRIEIIVKYGKL